MPEYLQFFEVDWSWPNLSEAERQVVRRFEALIQSDSGSVSLTWLMDVLADASLELPDREIHARAAEYYQRYSLAARDGRCFEARGIAFDPDGRCPEQPTADDFRAAEARNVNIGLYWPEKMLEAIKTQAHRLDASLSWIVQKAWIVARELESSPTATESELPSDGATRKQSMYLPVAMYAEISERAGRNDSSMSRVLHDVLRAAWPTIAALPDKR